MTARAALGGTRIRDWPAFKRASAALGKVWIRPVRP